MDIRGCLLCLLVIISCLVTSYLAAAEPASAVDYGQLAPDMKISHLEQLIRRDIEREMQDILDLENHINSNLDFIKTKKRQLEIKKRQPLQCFLNIVSCWKRK